MDAEKLITDHLDTWTAAIKTKSSAGRGGGKKQELYGIKKLRELILELAVRGLLVPQDPEDEPASDLLKKISSKRSTLIKEGKLKKQKKLPRITDGDKPFTIPSNWEWIRLGDATNYGICDKAEASDVDEDTWVLELEDVEKSTSRLLTKVRFRERNFRSSKNRFSEADVIYGKLRPYLDKVLVADEPGVCTTEMIPVTPYSSISPAFLRLLMKAPYFIRYANDSTHGMNLPRMGTDLARAAMIPLAPEPEQKRIVAKVDELMALCDQLEQRQEDSMRTHATLVETLLGALTTASERGAFDEAWQRIASHFDTLFTTESSIDQLKQILLQLAVMGKLVPQDPEDEPASELLKKIASEKANLVKDGVIKKQKALPSVTDAEKPFELPSKWEFVRLDELCELITKGSSPKWQGVDYTQDPEDILFITSENVGSNVLLLSTEKFVERKFNEVSPRSILQLNDILMNIVGASIGRTAIFNIDRLANINQAVCLIRTIDSGPSRNFLLRFFNSATCVSYMYDKQVDNARANLSMGNISKFVIPLPPLAEQHRIVAKVDELMALCDRLKANLQNAQNTQLHLAESLVQTAIK
jgi:type I restriction enzyme S subunit